MRTWVTILCSVVTGMAAVALLVASFFGSHLDYLEEPEASIIAMAEKDLDLDAALDTLPEWERTLVHLLGYSHEDNLREIGNTYQRVIDYLPESDPSLLARLVILEAEQGDETRLDDTIDLLPATDDAERFIDAILYAYLGETPRKNPGTNGWNLSVLDAGNPRIDQTSWSRERVLARLAERDGESEAIGSFDRVAATRGQPPLRRGRMMEALYLLTLVAGLTVTVLLLRRSRRSMAIANGITVAPWSLRYGTGIIVRCVASAMGMVAVISLVSWWVWWAPLDHMYTLFTFLPMMFIMHHYLFRPDGGNLWQGFGMSPGTVSWKGIILFALALTAVDQVGCLVIENGARMVGLPVRWDEGLDETLLFGPLPLALMSTIDGVVWAPLFEEIAFRGLLYVTLRTRLTPLPAACISAGLFGIVHLYSVVGFLEVTWTGFILAVGYEKCRSLWPCIFAHAFNNLFYFGGLLLVYR